MNIYDIQYIDFDILGQRIIPGVPCWLRFTPHPFVYFERRGLTEYGSLYANEGVVLVHA